MLVSEITPLGLDNPQPRRVSEAQPAAASTSLIPMGAGTSTWS